MLRFLNVANALSLAGLGAALACALLAVSGRPALAIVALIGAGLCDLFDGLVARRLALTPEEQRFGAALDSAVDACSFGFAPAVLLHALGLRSLPEMALLGAFAACAVWRLAYFDTIGLAGEADARYYTGLPTTFVALVLPLAALAGFSGRGPLRIAAVAAAAGLAIAMVSPVRIRKPGGKWYAILLGIAVVLVAVYTIFATRFGGAT